MPPVRPRLSHVARLLPCAFLLASLALLCSCKPAQKPNTEQADERAMWLDSVPQLKSLNVSNACAIALALVSERLSADA